MKFKLLLIVVFIFNIIFTNDRITYEKKLYDKYIPSVFTVFGDEGKGTGFLFDNSKGLIATNYHVVQSSKHVVVKLNNKIKVRGRTVAKSQYDDMAIVQINPEITKNILNCTLAPVGYELFIGEKIYSMGSPLHQTEIFTKGIISKVLDRAILSADLNINHGNSGGPLFNSEEYVIGINTFGDFDNAGKLSGTVKIDPLYNLYDEGKKFILNNPDLPSADLLPLMPDDLFPADALKEAVYEEYYPKDYVINAKDFWINMTTPPLIYSRQKSLEVDLVEIRNRKIKKAKQEEDPDEMDDFIFNDLYSWRNYTTHIPPVVGIEIAPKVKATGLSVLGAMLTVAAAAQNSSNNNNNNTPAFHMKYKYKGDFVDAKLYKNGEELRELNRVVQLQPLVFFNHDMKGNTSSGKDLAKAGFYYFSIYDFAPINGEFSDYTIEISNISRLKNKKNITVKIKKKIIERIWNDFLPYTKLKN